MNLFYDEFKKNFINEIERIKDQKIIEHRENSSIIKPLFALYGDEDTLYDAIIYSIREASEAEELSFLCKLLESYGIKCKQNVSVQISTSTRRVFDVVATIKKRPIFIEIKAVNSGIYKYKPVVDECSSAAVQTKMKGYIVYLIKDDIDGNTFIEQVRDYMNKAGKNNIEAVFPEEFINEVLGNEEGKEFHAFMQDLNDEIHRTIGYQLTEVCTPYNLKKFKLTLHTDLPDFDYDQIKADADIKLLNIEEDNYDFQSKAYKNAYKDAREAINNNRGEIDNGYEVIKNIFMKEKRYELLLGGRDFAKSFLTSEWIYRKYTLGEELDNTFVIAGYLKSIEQLLWDIILIVGEGKRITLYHNDPGEVIDESSKDNIHATLGSLGFFLSDSQNRDLLSEIFAGDKNPIMAYFIFQIDDWMSKERNGYFHKDQLHDLGKVRSIRNETYFLYLLILGSVKLNREQIEDLMGKEDD